MPTVGPFPPLHMSRLRVFPAKLTRRGLTGVTSQNAVSEAFAAAGTQRVCDDTPALFSGAAVLDFDDLERSRATSAHSGHPRVIKAPPSGLGERLQIAI